MKFNCGPTRNQRRVSKKERLTNWHDHFCWLPVRMGPNDCRWLETIQRKFDSYSWYNDFAYDVNYREKP